MPFTIDFLDDGRVLEWEATADGAVATERDDYTPRFYVAARDPASDLDLTALQSVYDQHPDVVATETVARRPGFRRDEESVLVVDVAHIDRVTTLARQARQLSGYPIGDLACFNVDFLREFRYCLETGADPTPASELSTLRLSVPVTETSNDVYGELSVAGDTVTGSPKDILTAVQGALDAHDPDILVYSTSEIVPTLYEIATDAGVDDFSLSRWPDVDYQQLASRSTYSSYGRVGHSPARYNVPGRAIIDESNTFFFGETNLDGVLNLVSRSQKPVQELTARQESLQAPDDSTDVSAVIDGVLEAEEDAISTYRELIDAAEAAEDHVIEDLAVTILSDEEAHRTEFRGFQKEY